MHSSRWPKILKHFEIAIKRCFITEIDIYLSQVSVENTSGEAKILSDGH